MPSRTRAVKPWETRGIARERDIGCPPLASLISPPLIGRWSGGPGLAFWRVLVQPLSSVTVTSRVTLGPAPTSNVMLLVPCPAVIVPPVTVQEYVAPGPTSVVEAVLPVEPSRVVSAAVVV